jgi:hypothetical protein
MGTYFVKIFGIKFHENKFSVSRVAVGYADRQTNRYISGKYSSFFAKTCETGYNTYRHVKNS